MRSALPRHPLVLVILIGAGVSAQEPQTISVEIFDGSTGLGIGGAEIFRRVADGRLQRVGRTAADGTGRIDRPARRSPRNRFVACATGYAMGPVFERDAAPAIAYLARGVSFKGRVLLGSGRAADGLELVYHSWVAGVKDGRELWGFRMPRSVVTDDAGRFVIPGCRPDDRYDRRLSARLRPEHIDRFPALWRPRLSRWVEDFVDFDRSDAVPVVDLGDFDLRSMCLVDLKVTGAGGRPAPRARMFLARKDRLNRCGNVRETVVAIDAAGQARFLVPSGVMMILGAGSKLALGSQWIVARRGRTEDPFPVRLSLNAPVAVTGKVVNGIGSGIRGATVDLEWQKSDRVKDLRLPRITRPAAEESVAGPLNPLAFGVDWGVLCGWNHRATTRSGRGGRFAFELPAVIATFSIVARKRGFFDKNFGGPRRPAAPTVGARKIELRGQPITGIVLKEGER